eukprot:139058-Chlamydomonas_euryale.AAC.1
MSTHPAAGSAAPQPVPVHSRADASGDPGGSDASGSRGTTGGEPLLVRMPPPPPPPPQLLLAEPAAEAPP